MHKKILWPIRLIGLFISISPISAQVGEVIEQAVGRAVMVSTLHALEQEQYRSSKNPYQVQVRQPDFGAPDFDMEFWYGRPTVVVNPMLPDGRFDFRVMFSLAKANYNTWRVTIGPYIHPEEYDYQRREYGRTQLSKADSMSVFYRAVTGRVSIAGLVEERDRQNSLKARIDELPSSFSELSAAEQRWLYFGLFLYWVFTTIGIWSIFYKADCHPKGYAFIPFWRLEGLCRVAGYRSIAALWLLVPVANIVFWLVLHVRLCRSFGMPGWLGLLALVFPPGLWWIIGRSEDARYQYW